MKRLHVLYDAECELCRRVRLWLARQPADVPLDFIPLQTPDLAQRFPGVAAFRPDQEIVVISDEGAVWWGGHAWITVLWALREYRPWAQRLARPALIPLARQACALVSENRHALSRWFAQADADQLRARLASLPDAGCTRPGPCRVR